MSPVLLGHVPVCFFVYTCVNVSLSPFPHLFLGPRPRWSRLVLHARALQRDNVSPLLREFEERFAWFSALDMTILDTGCVLLFVKAVDVRDREQVGLLLETDNGLMTD